MTLPLRARLLFLAGLLMFQLAWVVALPTFSAMDEFDHAYRAGSVAAGHWEAGQEPATRGGGVLVRVPSDLPAAARERCLDLPYTGWDNCLPRTSPDASDEVVVASTAGTYNPVYYWMAGSVASPWSGDAALYAMRLATIIVSDLLLLAALTLSRRQLSGWALVGLAVALTPTIIYATATAAPNGVCFAAGILVWTALLRLPRGGGEPVTGPLLALVTGGSLLMTTHSTGALWLIATLACGSPLWWPRLLHLARNHLAPLVATLSVLAGVMLACAAWILTSGTNDPRTAEAVAGDPSLGLLLRQPPFLFLQSVATLQFRNQAAPALVYVITFLVLAVLAFLAWGRMGRRSRTTVVLTILVSLGVPLLATWLTYSHLGTAWQGRYGFPLYVGTILVAVETTRGLHLGRRTAVAISLGAGTIHATTLAALLAFEYDAGQWTGGAPARYAVVTLMCMAGAILWASAMTRAPGPAVPLVRRGAQDQAATVGT